MSHLLPHIAFNLNIVGKECQKKRKQKQLAGQSCKGCKMNHSH